MADIFISYKKEDAGRVVRIVEALREAGFSVWWDHGIPPGAQWDETIKRELQAARIVCAVWSKLSVGAPWVKEEAAVGKARGALAPVRIDDVEPPLGFGLIQAADLRGWQGDRNDPRWEHFLEALRAILAGEPARLEVRARPRRRLLAAGVVLGLAAAAVLLAVALALRTPPPPAPLAGLAPGVSAPAASAPAVPSPGAGEQALWDKAQSEKSRAAFQSYLVAYPAGVYAARARDALLTCRSETRELWKPSPIGSNQAVRGVGSVPDDGATEVQACAAAKRMAQTQAQTNCEAIASGGGYRNPSWKLLDRDCTCSQSGPLVRVCVVDLPAQCNWESLVPEVTEICGG